MAAYLVLYRGMTSASEQMANTTPEMAKAGMEAWMTWAATAGSRCSKSSRCPASCRSGRSWQAALEHHQGGHAALAGEQPAQHRGLGVHQAGRHRLEVAALGLGDRVGRPVPAGDLHVAVADRQVPAIRCCAVGEIEPQGDRRLPLEGGDVAGRGQPVKEAAGPRGGGPRGGGPRGGGPRGARVFRLRVPPLAGKPAATFPGAAGDEPFQRRSSLRQAWPQTRPAERDSRPRRARGTAAPCSAGSAGRESGVLALSAGARCRDHQRDEPERLDGVAAAGRSSSGSSGPGRPGSVPAAGERRATAAPSPRCRPAGRTPAALTGSGATARSGGSARGRLRGPAPPSSVRQRSPSAARAPCAA